MRNLRLLLVAGLAAAAFACRAAEPVVQERADRFLNLVNAAYQALSTVDGETQWVSVTDVTPAHDAAYEAAHKAYAAFNGNPAIIKEAKELLQHRAELNEITWRQLDRVLLNAAEGPMTNPKLVAARIAAETAQASTLNSFEFKLGGKVVTANDIDNLLQSSVDLNERRAVWEASKESGKALKPGLIKLRELRNGVAQEMGYPDYFALQVASYQMTTDDMVRLNDEFMRVLRPLYLQLHTWVKYKLAEKYHQPVP
jgi:peptidyl-dipeptidase A